MRARVVVNDSLRGNYSGRRHPPRRLATCTRVYVANREERERVATAEREKKEEEKREKGVTAREEEGGEENVAKTEAAEAEEKAEEGEVFVT